MLCVHRQGLDGDEFEVKDFVSSAAAAVAKDVVAAATDDEVVDGGCRCDGRLENDAGAQGVLEGKEEPEDCAHESFAGLRPPGKPGLGFIQDGICGELVKPNTENSEERGGERYRASLRPCAICPLARIWTTDSRGPRSCSSRLGDA